MWTQLLESIMNLTPYPQRSRYNRAVIAYSSVYVFAVLFTLYGVLVPFGITLGDSGFYTYLYRALRPATFPLFSFSFIAFYVLGGYAIWQLWHGRLEQITLIPSAMIYLGGVGIAIVNNLGYAQNAYLLLPPLLIAGLLDGDRGLLIFTPIHFALLVVGYSLYLGVDPINQFSDLVLMVMISVTFVGLLYLYLRNARLTLDETEDVLLRQRLQIAQLTTRITRTIAQADNLNVVLNQVVQEIRATFPRAYHVQIFLIESTGRTAELVASTGEVGQQLLANQHSLPVGSTSVIGYVTQQQRPYRAIVHQDATVHRPNPLLPDTRLEMALPLNVGTRTIGALDLQSTDPDGLTLSDLTTLQAIADAIAVTINNTRLLDETNQRLAENQRLVEQMSVTQREVERLNRELTGAIWADYLRGSDSNYDLELDFEHDQISSAKELSDALLDAINRDDIIRKQDPNGQAVIAVPLRVRGEVIGAMEFEVDGDVSGSDLDMLREVGERFGLAAENTRLYQNSQRIAQREALVNEISTRIQSANSVDATIAEAARSLRDALKAQRVAIRLGTPARPQPKPNGRKE